MSEIRRSRNYRLLGLDLQVAASATMLDVLDSRFRLLPSDAAPAETISLNFQSVSDGSCHIVTKPQQKGRSFYNLPSGETCYFEADDQIYLSFADGVRVLASPTRGSASFSVVESEPVNLFVASHLVLTIVLVEMLKRRGRYSMHAAGFVNDGRAILIPGTSGAGKSTLAVTLLRSGFGYLSDDMVFLQRRAEGLEVLGFAEDIDVTGKTISFFPELDFLRRSLDTAGRSKQQVRVDEVYSAELVRQAQPGAIVFPQISGNAHSTVRQIDADEAFLEMVSNVLLTDPHACRSHLLILTELVKHTPCYRLDTGRDFDRIPELLRELLTGSREKIRA
jgi:hypothetical protein